MRFLVFSMALLFGILSLAPNMQGGQFFKLPQMLDHYEHHQTNGESFSSFLAFIQEHYFSNKQTNANESKMPFKTVVAAPFVLLVEEINLFIVTESFTQLAKQCHTFGDTTEAINARVMPIWNPPKLV